MNFNGLKKVKLGDALESLIDYRGKTPQKAAFGIPLITAKIVKGDLYRNQRNLLPKVIMIRGWLGAYRK